MVAPKDEPNVQAIDDQDTNEKHAHKAIVTLLDGNKISINIDKNAKGGDLYTKVVNHLNILEQDYFSLAYYDHENIRIWLYNEKKISKQLQNLPWNFEFQVKFYPPEPAALQEDITRFHLCLQIQRDVVTGKLPCSLVTYALLGSYLVQSQLGDYDCVQHGPPHNYLAHFQFAPTNSSQLADKVHELHKTHKGQTPGEAELHYLENAKKLAMYGIDMYPAKDSEGNEVQIGVCSAGIMIFRERLRIHRFAWPKIVKISYRRNNYYIKTKPGEFEQYETTVGYKVANFRAAKRVWKSSVEHHTFFRLMQPEEPPRKGLFRWGSQRFRYSGRTQFQTKMASQMFDRPAPSVERCWSARQTTQSLDATPLNMQSTAAGDMRYADAGSVDLQQYPDATPCPITIDTQNGQYTSDDSYTLQQTSPIERYHAYLKDLSDRSLVENEKLSQIRSKGQNRSNLKKLGSASNNSLSETSQKNISLCGFSSREHKHEERTISRMCTATKQEGFANIPPTLAYTPVIDGELCECPLELDKHGLHDENVFLAEQIYALHQRRNLKKQKKYEKKEAKRVLKGGQKKTHKFGFQIGKRARSESLSSLTSISSSDSDGSVKPEIIPHKKKRVKTIKNKLGYADVSASELAESQIQPDQFGVNDQEGLTAEQIATLNERRGAKKQKKFSKKEAKRAARKEGKGKFGFGFGFAGFGRRTRSDSLSSISSSSSSDSDASAKEKKITEQHLQAQNVQLEGPKVIVPSLKKKKNVKEPKVMLGYADVSASGLPESHIQPDQFGLNDQEGLTTEQIAALNASRDAKKQKKAEKKEVKRASRQNGKDKSSKFGFGFGFHRRDRSGSMSSISSASSSDSDASKKQKKEAELHVKAPKVVLPSLKKKHKEPKVKLGYADVHASELAESQIQPDWFGVNDQEGLTAEQIAAINARRDAKKQKRSGKKEAKRAARKGKFGFGFGGFGRRARSDSLSSISSVSSSDSDASAKDKKITELHVQAPKVELEGPEVDVSSLKKRKKVKEPKVKLGYADVSASGLPESQIQPDQFGLNDQEGLTAEQIAALNASRNAKKQKKAEKKEVKRASRQNGKDKSSKFGFGFGFHRRDRSGSMSSISSASSSDSDASKKQKKEAELHVKAPKVVLPSLKKKHKEPKVKLGYADVHASELAESQIQPDRFGVNDQEGLTAEQIAAINARRDAKKQKRSGKKEAKRAARKGKFGFGFGGFGRRARSDSLSSISSVSSSDSDASAKDKKITELHVQAPKVELEGPEVDVSSLKKRKKVKEPKVKLGYADVSASGLPESQIQPDQFGLNDQEGLTAEQIAALNASRNAKKQKKAEKKEVKRASRQNGKDKSSKFGFGFGFHRRDRSGSMSSISSASSSDSDASKKQKKEAELHVKAPKVVLPSLKKKHKEPKVKLGYADVHASELAESQIQPDRFGVNDQEGLTAEQIAAINARRDAKKQKRSGKKEAKRAARKGKFGFGFGGFGRRARSDSLSSISSVSSSDSDASAKDKKITELHVQAPKVELEGPEVDVSSPKKRKKVKEPKVKLGYADVSASGLPESQIQPDQFGLNDQEGLTAEQIAALNASRNAKKQKKAEKKEVKRASRQNGKDKSSKFGFGFGFHRRDKSGSMSSISSASSSDSDVSKKQKKEAELHVKAPKVELPSLKKKDKEPKVKLGYADVHASELAESQIQPDQFGVNDQEGLTAEQIAAINARRDAKKQKKSNKKEAKRAARKVGKGKFGFGFGGFGRRARSDSLSSISSVSSSDSDASVKEKKITELHVQAPKVELEGPEVDVSSLKKRKKVKEPKVKLGYADVSASGLPESQIQPDQFGLNDQEGLTAEQIAALNASRNAKKQKKTEKKEVKRASRQNGKDKSSKFGFGFGFHRRDRSGSMSSISSASSSDSDASKNQKKEAELHVKAPKVELPSLKKKHKEAKVKLGYADVHASELAESQIQPDRFGVNDQEGLTAEQIAAINARRDAKKQKRSGKKEAKRAARKGKFGFGFGGFGRRARSDSLSSISSVSSSDSDASAKDKKITELHVQAPKVELEGPEVDVSSLKKRKKVKEPKVKLGYADVSASGLPESQIQPDQFGLNDQEGLTAEQITALNASRNAKKQKKAEKKEVKRASRQNGKDKSSKFGFGFGFHRRDRSGSMSSISSASSSDSDASKKQKKEAELHVKAPKVELPSLKKKHKEPKVKLGYADVHACELAESQIQPDQFGVNDQEGLTAEQIAAINARRDAKKQKRSGKKEAKRAARKGKFGFGGFGRRARSDSLSSISSVSSSDSDASAKDKKITELHVQAPKVELEGPEVDVSSLKKKKKVKEPKVKLGYADVSASGLPESQIQPDQFGLNDQEGLTAEQIAALNASRNAKKQKKAEKKEVKRASRQNGKDKSSKFGFGFGFHRRDRSGSMSSISSASSSDSDASKKQKKEAVLHVKAPKVELPSLKKKHKEPKVKLGYADVHASELVESQIQPDQFGVNDQEGLTAEQIAAINARRDAKKQKKSGKKEAKRAARKGKFGFGFGGFGRRARSDSLSSISSVSSSESDASAKDKKITELHVQAPKVELEGPEVGVSSLKKKKKVKEPKVKLGYADVSASGLPESQIQPDQFGLNDQEGLTAEQIAALNASRNAKKQKKAEKKEVKRASRQNGKDKSSKFGFGFGFHRRDRSGSMSSISSASSSDSDASKNQKKEAELHVKAPKVELPSLKKKHKEPKVKLGYADVHASELAESQIQPDRFGVNDQEGLTAEQIAAINARRDAKKQKRSGKKEAKRAARKGKFGFGFGGFGRRARSDSLSSISSVSSSDSDASAKDKKITELHVQAPKVELEGPEVDVSSLKKRKKVKEPKVKLGYADVSASGLPESQIQPDQFGLNDQEGLTAEQIAALNASRNAKKQKKAEKKEVKRASRQNGKDKSSKFGFGFGFHRRDRSGSMSSISSASSSDSDASKKQKKEAELHVKAPKVELPSLKKKHKEPKVKLGYADVHACELAESQIQPDQFGVNDQEGLTAEQIAAINARRDAKKQKRSGKKEAKRAARKEKFGFGGFGRRARSDSISSISSVSSSDSDASAKDKKITELHVQAPKVELEGPEVDVSSLKKKKKVKEPKVKLGYADVSASGLPESQIQPDQFGLNDQEGLTAEQIAALNASRNAKKQKKAEKKEVKRASRQNGKDKSSKFGFAFGFHRRDRSGSMSSISSASSSDSDASKKQKKESELHVKAPKVELPSLKKKDKEPKVKLGYADVHASELAESQIQPDQFGVNDQEGLTAEQIAAINARRDAKKQKKSGKKEAKRAARKAKYGFGFGGFGRRARSDSLSSISSVSSSESDASAKDKKITELHVQAPTVELEGPEVGVSSLKKKKKVKLGYADVSASGLPESQIQPDQFGLNDQEGLTAEQIAALNASRNAKKQKKAEKKEVKRASRQNGKDKSSKFGFGFGFHRRDRSGSMSSISSASSSDSDASKNQKKEAELHVKAPKVELPSLKKKHKEPKVKLGYADVHASELAESQIQPDRFGVNDQEGLTAEQIAAINARRDAKKQKRSGKKEAKRAARKGKFGFGFGGFGRRARSDSLSSISSVSSSESDASAKDKKITELHVQAPKVELEGPEVGVSSLKKKKKVKEPKVKLGYADVSASGLPESQIQPDQFGLNDQEGLTAEQIAALNASRNAKKQKKAEKKEVKRASRQNGKDKSSKFGFGFGFHRRDRSGSMSSINSASSSDSDASKNQKKEAELHVKAPKVELPSLKKKHKEPKVKLGYADVHASELAESQIQPDRFGVNDQEGLTAEQIAAINARRDAKKQKRSGKKEAKRAARKGKFGFGFGGFGRRARSDSLSSISSVSSSDSDASAKDKKITELHVQAPKVELEGPEVDVSSLKKRKKVKEPKVKLGYADVSASGLPESQIQPDQFGLNDQEGLTAEQIAALNASRNAKKQKKAEKKEVKRASRQNGKDKSSKFGFGFGFHRRDRSGSMSSISSASSSDSDASKNQKKEAELRVKAPKVELLSLKKKHKEPKVKLGYADVHASELAESQIQPDQFGVNDQEGLTAEQIAAINARRDAKKQKKSGKKEAKRAARKGKFGFGFGGFGRRARSDSLSSISSVSSSDSDASAKDKKITELHVQAPKFELEGPEVDVSSLKKKKKVKEPKVKLGYADVSASGLSESQIQPDQFGLNDQEGLTAKQIAALNASRNAKKQKKAEKKEVKRASRQNGKDKSSKFGFGFGFHRRDRSGSMSSISSASSSDSDASKNQKKEAELRVKAPKVELPSLKKKHKEPKVKLGYADVHVSELAESQIQHDQFGVNDQEGLTPEQIAAINARRDAKKQKKSGKKEAKRAARKGKFGFGFGGFGRRARSDSLSSISSVSSSDSDASAKDKKITELHVQAPKVELEGPEVDVLSLKKKKKVKEPKVKLGYADVSASGLPESQIQPDQFGLNDQKGLTAEQIAALNASRNAKKQKKAEKKEVKRASRQNGKDKSSKFGFGFGFHRRDRSGSMSSISSASSSDSDASKNQKKEAELHVKAPKVELPSLKKKHKEPKVKLGYADVHASELAESQIQPEQFGVNDQEGLTAEQIAAINARRDAKKQKKSGKKEAKRAARKGGKGKFGFGFGGFGRRARSGSLSSISSVSSSDSDASAKEKKITELHVHAPKVELEGPEVDVSSLKKKKKVKEPKVKLGYADVSASGLPESQIQPDQFGLNDQEGLTAEQIAALNASRNAKKQKKAEKKEVKRASRQNGKDKSSKFGFGFGFHRRDRSGSMSSISSASSSDSDASKNQKKEAELRVKAPKVELPSLKKKDKEPKVKLGYADVHASELAESQIQPDQFGVNDQEGLTAEQIAAINARRDAKKQKKSGKKEAKRAARKGKFRFGFGGFGRRARSGSLSSISSVSSSDSDASTKDKKITELHVQAPKVELEGPEVDVSSLKKRKKVKEPKVKLGYADVSASGLPESQIQPDQFGLNDQEGLTAEQIAALNASRNAKKQKKTEKKEVKRASRQNGKDKSSKFGFGFGFHRRDRSGSMSSISSASSSDSDASKNQKKEAELHVKAPKVELPSLKKKHKEPKVKLGYADVHASELAESQIQPDQFGVNDREGLTAEQIVALNMRRDAKKHKKSCKKEAKRAARKEGKWKFGFGFGGFGRRARSDSLSSISSVSSSDSDALTKEKKMITELNVQAPRVELEGPNVDILSRKKKKKVKEHKVKLGYVDVSASGLPESQIHQDQFGLNDQEGLTAEQITALNASRDAKKQNKSNKKEAKKAAWEEGKRKHKFHFGFGGFGKRGRSYSLSSISSGCSSDSELSKKKAAGLNVEVNDAEVYSELCQQQMSSVYGHPEFEGTIAATPLLSVLYDVDDVPCCSLQVEKTGVTDLQPELSRKQIISLTNARIARKQHANSPNIDDSHAIELQQPILPQGEVRYRKKELFFSRLFKKSTPNELQPEDLSCTSVQEGRLSHVRVSDIYTDHSAQEDELDLTNEHVDSLADHHNVSSVKKHKHKKRVFRFLGRNAPASVSQSSTENLSEIAVPKKMKKKMKPGSDSKKSGVDHHDIFYDALAYQPYSDISKLECLKLGLDDSGIVEKSKITANQMNRLAARRNKRKQHKLKKKKQKMKKKKKVRAQSVSSTSSSSLSADSYMVQHGSHGKRRVWRIIELPKSASLPIADHTELHSHYDAGAEFDTSGLKPSSSTQHNTSLAMNTSSSGDTHRLDTSYLQSSTSGNVHDAYAMQEYIEGPLLSTPTKKPRKPATKTGFFKRKVKECEEVAVPVNGHELNVEEPATNGHHPPQTTVTQWEEQTRLPPQVHSQLDQSGNVITTTTKNVHSVQRTTERKSVESFATDSRPTSSASDAAVVHTSRQLFTPVSEHQVHSVNEVPLVQTQTRTVRYETNGTSGRQSPPADAQFVSSQTVTSGNRTVETITYKLERDGVVETHVEHRVTIHSADDELDHDVELNRAIVEATQMNPNMTVEKIEVRHESQC